MYPEWQGFEKSCRIKLWTFSSCSQSNYQIKAEPVIWKSVSNLLELKFYSQISAEQHWAGRPCLAPLWLLPGTPSAPSKQCFTKQPSLFVLGYLACKVLVQHMAVVRVALLLPLLGVQ